MVSTPKNMNRKRPYKTSPTGFFLLILFLNQSAQAAAIDSLAFYNAQYSRQVERLGKLDKEIKQYKAEIATLDAQIIKLNSNQNPNWIEKRNLTRLTAQKAAINENLIKVYNSQTDVMNSADLTYNQYCSFLSKAIDTALDKYSTLNDPHERQYLSRNLVDLVEKRSQVLATRNQYPGGGNPTLLQKENLISLITKFDQNTAIRQDVSHILNDKIHQIDLMIAAANTEKEFRKRLNQLNLEMGTLTGDAYTYTGGRINDRASKNATDSYNWGSLPTTNETYDRNLINNAALPATNQPLTATDYLPYFQKIQTSDLPLHITRLDSLRQYYKKQLQEINGNK